MSEIKLTIDEVIEHCRETCERAELVAQLRDAEITSKQYWEHKQVAEWLKELKQLRGAMERIVERLEDKRTEYEKISEQKYFDMPQACYYKGYEEGFKGAIKICKEEGGTSD